MYISLYCFYIFPICINCTLFCDMWNRLCNANFLNVYSCSRYENIISDVYIRLLCRFMCIEHDWLFLGKLGENVWCSVQYLLCNFGYWIYYYRSTSIRPARSIIYDWYVASSRNRSRMIDLHSSSSCWCQRPRNSQTTYKLSIYAKIICFQLNANL